MLRPYLASHPSKTAAKREPGNAGRRHDAAARCEAEHLRFPVNISPGSPAFSANRLRLGVNAHPAHQGKIDHHAVVA